MSGAGAIYVKTGVLYAPHKHNVAIIYIYSYDTYGI